MLHLYWFKGVWVQVCDWGVIYNNFQIEKQICRSGTLWVRPQRTVPRTKIVISSKAPSCPLAQNLVTHHDNRWRLLAGSSSPPISLSLNSLNLASTFTVPFSKTSPSHNFSQLSGECANLIPPLVPFRSPTSGSPTCEPKIMEPGSGESRHATALAR